MQISSPRNRYLQTLLMWAVLLAVPRVSPAQDTLRLAPHGAIGSHVVDHVENGLVAGDFPPLPPSPDEDDGEPLPPLEEELFVHGGSYLYQAEGDRLNWPADAHHQAPLRLPQGWQAPQPFTLGAEFLGADPVLVGPAGRSGYSHDSRFVAYGSYVLFTQGFEQAGQRQDLVGHNLRLDLDLRWSGTERIHVQFRPLGERNTGGSFYQFNAPETYVNNSTGEPDRYWLEGELHSLLGWEADPAAQRYVNFMLGKFPFTLHNALLINDEIVGAVVSQNNLQFCGLSNLNVQWFVGANDVDPYPGNESQVYGVHLSADCQRDFYEATYAHTPAEAGRSTDFAALSRTKFYGPLTIAMRGMVKLGDDAGSGSAHLLTLESNWHRVFCQQPLGFEHGVFFCNSFWAAAGWNAIAGTNFNRLRTAFEVDPLVRLASTPTVEEAVGVTLGVQLFRRHEDESFVPELAWESRGGDSVFGFGCRYLRKTGPRTYVELLGVVNGSSNPAFDREGLALTHTYLF